MFDLASWGLGPRIPSPSRRRKGSTGIRRRLGIDALEDRRLLAILTVNGVGDSFVPNACVANVCDSLRGAVNLANSTAGADTIQFNIGTFSPTISLTAGELGVDKSTTVDGLNRGAGGFTSIVSTPSSRIWNVVQSTFVEEEVFVVLDSLTLIGGSARDGLGGGAILNQNANLTIRNLRISDNNSAVAGVAGGGIANRGGVLTVTESTFEANSAQASGVNGGAIASVGTAVDPGQLIVRNSTFSGNLATGSGGAIFAQFSSVLIEQSTISGNVSNANGGGIALSNTNNAVFSRSTIVNNGGNNGGGIHMPPGVSGVIMTNTILADNTAITSGPDLFDSAPFNVTADFSFVGTNSGNGLVPGTNGNMVGLLPPISPNLGQLGDNGGPTRTHVPNPGSLVIDHGSGSRPLGKDQRGFVEFFPTVVDMGSVETGSDAGLDADFDGDYGYGCTDVNALSEAIAHSEFDPRFDVNLDATLNQLDLVAWLVEAGRANIGPGRNYLFGDANLDGFVDGSDFNIWNSHKFSPDSAWCSGNFNADGAIDGSDFNIWNSNKFSASDSPRSATIPAARQVGTPAVETRTGKVTAIPSHRPQAAILRANLHDLLQEVSEDKRRARKIAKREL